MKILPLIINNLRWIKYFLYFYRTIVIKDIIFTDSLNGFIILHSNSNIGYQSGKLYKTIDGGNSWSDVPFINNDNLRILSASFINNNIGIIILKDQRIYKTIDGGEHWVKCNYNKWVYLTYIKMFDTKNVLASGSQFVLYSYDGGINWWLAYPTGKDCQEGQFEVPMVQPVYAPTGITDVYGRFFKSMGMGWACGDYGVITKFTDPQMNFQKTISKATGSVYFSPNPTNGVICFNASDIPEYVFVFDNNGKVVFHTAISNQKLDLSVLHSGSYFLRMIKSSESRTVKLIKL